MSDQFKIYEAKDVEKAARARDAIAIVAGMLLAVYENVTDGMVSHALDQAVDLVNLATKRVRVNKAQPAATNVAAPEVQS